jgi:hypothetical protein
MNLNSPVFFEFDFLDAYKMPNSFDDVGLHQRVIRTYHTSTSLQVVSSLLYEYMVRMYSTCGIVRDVGIGATWHQSHHSPVHLPATMSMMVFRSSVPFAVVALLACCCCTRAFVVEPRYRAGVATGFPNAGRKCVRPLREPVVRQSNGINGGASTNDNSISLKEAADDVLPEYKDGDSAVSVLSKRYFYNKALFDNPSNQELIQQSLAAAFGGMTVGEVRQKYTELQLMKKAQGVPAMLIFNVVEFIAQGETLEDKLHNKIIPFNSIPEVKVVEQRFTRLDSSQILLETELKRFFSKQTDIEPDSTRSDPAFFVLGPSGSGKSVFALKYVATFEIPMFEKQQNTTWYLKLSDLGFNADNLTPESLVDRMEKEILKVLNRTAYEKLDMHVSIVIDEAGDGSLGGFFEKKENISTLLNLVDRLATSVRLVICGTGLETTNLDSGKDACKFRMLPWGAGDLDAILRTDRFAFDEATRKSVIGAIGEQPTLNALSTNGRSAYFLLSAIRGLRTVFNASKPWRLLLASVVSDIVGTVVRRYMGENGLSKLKEERERRRVAAWVLRAVRTARTESKPKVPSFSGLTVEEKAVAMSLIDLNIDYSKEQVRYARDTARSAVLVTPAISIVLCILLGVPATIFSTWRAQEQITGLYAVGDQALNYLEQYCKDNNIPTDGNEESPGFIRPTAADPPTALDEQLADLELLHVAIPVPSKSTQVAISVPWLNATDVWVNGDKAKFADVIAPYILYQCKHCSTSGDSITVNVTEELWKCGLLKKNNSTERDNAGWIVLRWLVGVWSGKFKDARKPDATTTSAEAIRRTEERHLKSVAYPYNLLDTPTSIEEVPYRSITLNNATGEWAIDGESLPADPPADTCITFVISTNAAKVSLSGMVEKVLEKQSNGTIIERENKVEFSLTDKLDANGRVIEKNLSEPQKRVWNELKAKFRCSVDLKFLLT